ncbi:MAG TPA: sigma-70 family RNA polymerase sigma factor [Solirubrobacteraceae bacterium]|nr:sigma-70 family RNA polymerase sigma factor [Solirubrobacteraceae bacterium]
MMERQGDAAERPEELREEVERGRRLDRALTRDLGRPSPERPLADATYADSLERARVLPPEVEDALVRAAKTGDVAARARLVEAHMPLIAGAARTYRGGTVQRVELLQEGVVGFLRALERFDPGRPTPLWGYATWWVRHAMQQLVSELTRPVVLSDRALRQLARLKDAHGEATRDGRRPTRADLAERTGLDLDHVDALLATERAPRSLEQPVTAHGDEVGVFGDLVADPLADGEYERVLAAIEIAELHTLLASLSDRERAILRARFGLGEPEASRREIGERLGLSGERVRQLEQRALAKLAAAWGE